ncbi:erythromycin esterase family protein [Kutzneria sp. CA-103260]|uniref:erythromycin esterase family protein n=1 Tax=Kutzneria sp. CA-103260 TaxID=2802641 RepID=UPI001BA676D6|nr:erythromycin esterase family protein [Kutzneria sp. CA-103260]QUQ63529.1 Erythromycin esterase [Kutzneria sp. CA-103260]
MDRLSDAAVFSLDDLDRLDEALGGARVVAIGESSHYNREQYLLRHRLFRHLAQRHGFRVYAMESGFVEGWDVDKWVRGDDSRALGDLLANGVTGLMGLWTELREHLEWMREHRIGFYGTDLPGSNASTLPGLDPVLAYLAEADPQFEVDPRIREVAVSLSAPSAFSQLVSLNAYTTSADKDTLSAGLADLRARLISGRIGYVRRTSVEAYERALRALDVTIGLDGTARGMARGDQPGGMEVREVTIADTVDWILRREERIVLVEHNAHVQRRPSALPGMRPMAVMGVHLADRLGDDYRVVGTTTGGGQALNMTPSFYEGVMFADLDEPKPDSLDGLMAASRAGDEPFAVDLRRLSPADEATVSSAKEQRYGVFYSEVDALAAYDVVVHLPHVTGATLDQDTLSHAVPDVRDRLAGK